MKNLKKILFGSVGAIALVLVASTVFSFATPAALAQTNQATGTPASIQVSTLVITGISPLSSGSGVMVVSAANQGGYTSCQFYSASLNAVPGCTPSFPNYQITVTTGTKLLLGDRSAGTAGDFAVGDQINVYGPLASGWNVSSPLAINALILRDVSKPLGNYQFNAVKVVALPSANIAIIAIQPQSSCVLYFPNGTSGTATVCPGGLTGTTWSNPDDSNILNVPVPAGQKDVIHMTAATQILFKDRSPATFANIAVGDIVNVYGALEPDGTDVQAQIFRMVNKLATTPPVSPPSVSSTSSPIITQLSPSAGSVGTQVTITGTGFSPTDNTVMFDNLSVDSFGDIPSANGTSLTFTVPSSYSPPCTISGACLQTIIGFLPGDYSVTVSNASDSVSNALNFTITTSGAPVTPPSSPTAASTSLSQLSPGSGPAGTQVTITGSGFSPTDNTISFSGDTILDVPSASGVSLSFTVPQNYGPHCIASEPCPEYVVEVMPGTYPVSVTNAGGAVSNALNFTVTASNVPITPPPPTTTPQPSNAAALGSQFQPVLNQAEMITDPALNGATVLDVTYESAISTGTCSAMGNASCPSSIEVLVSDMNGNSQTLTLTSDISNTNFPGFTLFFPGFTSGSDSVFLTVTRTPAVTTPPVSSPPAKTTDAVPSLSFISPNTGTAGTSLTLSGKNFTATGNEVIVMPPNSSVAYTAASLQSLASPTGQKLSFAFPAQITCSPSLVPSATPVTCAATLMTSANPGVYSVSVVNAGGTSNAVSFTLLNSQSTSPTLGTGTGSGNN